MPLITHPLEGDVVQHDDGVGPSGYYQFNIMGAVLAYGVIRQVTVTVAITKDQILVYELLKINEMVVKSTEGSRHGYRKFGEHVRPVTRVCYATGDHK